MAGWAVELRPQVSKPPPLGLTGWMVAPSGWSGFWFQAEVGSRFADVVGVQTWPVPISTWAGPVLVIARSATARTVVVTVAEVLLARFESYRLPLTVAALVTAPPSLGVGSLSAIVATSFLGSETPDHIPGVDPEL